MQLPNKTAKGRPFHLCRETISNLPGFWQKQLAHELVIEELTQPRSRSADLHTSPGTGGEKGRPPALICIRVLANVSIPPHALPHRHTTLLPLASPGPNRVCLLQLPCHIALQLWQLVSQGLLPHSRPQARWSCCAWDAMCLADPESGCPHSLVPLPGTLFPICHSGWLPPFL